MQILFVHGMGRTPLSAAPLLLQLSLNGFKPGVFAYTTALQGFAAICQRLSQRIVKLAEKGPYCLVGHSLGGVMIRKVLSELPAGVALPAHVFLLGSPQRASSLAQKLNRQLVYRALCGDCGALLASDTRMAEVAALQVPTTSIVGISGPTGKWSPFQQALNDGVVAAAEARADWLTDEVRVPVIHTLLPASGRVLEVILQKLQQRALA